MRQSYPEKYFEEIRKFLAQVKTTDTKENIAAGVPRIEDILNHLEEFIWNEVEAEDNYRRIVENMQDIYYRADLEGNLIMVSPSIKNILGYTPEEAIGNKIAESFYEDPEKKMELFNILQEKGEAKNYEVNLYSKEGRVVPILSNSHFIYDKEGNPTGIEGTITDITERKKAENALRESEEKYRSVVDNAPTGIFIVNEKFQFIYSNEKLSKILDYTNKEIQGMDFRKMLDEDSTEIVVDRYQRRQRGEQVPPKYEIGVIAKNGKKRTLEMRVAVITTGQGIKNTVGQVLDITEQKAAEENLKKKEQKLKESEEKFRSLTNQLPVGVYRTTPDGKFIYFNHTLAEMLGYKTEELINIPVPHLYKKSKDREEGIKYLLNHPEGFTQREIQLKTKTGSVIIVNDHINPVLDEKGKVKYFDGVLEEITERKKTEQALKESEEKFRQLAQTTSTAIMVYQDDKWVYANPAAERISGYTEEQLKTKNYWEFVAPEYQEMIRKRGKRRQKDEEVPSGYEFRIITKSGEERWVYLEGSLMEYQGKPAGLISVIDVTRMKQTEQQLKERNKELKIAEEELLETNNALKEINRKLEKQKEELETAKNEAEENAAKRNSLLEAIPDMIFVFDKNGYIRDYHAEKKEFLYTQPNNFLNKKVDDVLPPYLVKLTYNTIEKVLSTGNVEEYEYELELKNKRYVFESRMVMLNKNSTLAIVRDITETKEAREELIKAKEKAEESDRLKSAFLANMSHEIRTPINGIVGFTQLLREEEYSKEEQEEFFNIIDLNSNQLLQIINDIIDISKIEADQLSINKKPFSLNKLMDDLYNSYMVELKQKNKIHLIVKVNKELKTGEDNIRTDPIRLKQIMTNLLTNAAKFTDNGTIDFGYKLSGEDEFLFFVKDTGIGIPAEKQKIIFNHFRRAHETKASKYGGTGLGLSISRRLVEMMGGKIWVESEENQGAHFFFTLNAKKQEAYPEIEKEDTRLKSYNWNHSKILVVEDDPSSQRFIRETLKSTRANVLFTDNGADAIKNFTANPDTSIILMDIKLPDKDGLEITRKIREINKDVPIIATTAYAMENDKSQAIEHGCNDYLSKPLDKNELLKTMNKYMHLPD